MNSVFEPANKELAQIFDEFAADREQRVAMLTGAVNRAFCAGNDLKAVWSSDGADGMPKDLLA